MAMMRGVDAGLALAKPPEKPDQFVPTIAPSMEEFKDFAKVIRDARAAHPGVGAIKIKPPPEWHPRRAHRDYCDVGDIVIPIPIQQVVRSNTSAGVFDVINIERKSMTVAEYAEEAKAQAHTIRAGDKDDEPAADPAEEIANLERKFWTNLLSLPATYGADMEGTLMDNDLAVWNLQKLPSLLDLLSQSMPGINRPYLYFGMWKALFAWHVEDMDLYSINYLHFGKPKIWYVIPPSQANRFENFVQTFFPHSYNHCHQFLRHKSSLISPKHLARDGIKYHKICQEAGEFVITFPLAYHAGFNAGFNCAESVNFALEDWIPYGMKSVRCKCDSERASINMNTFMYQYEMRKYGQAITAVPPDDLDQPIGPPVTQKRSMTAPLKQKNGVAHTSAPSTKSAAKPAKAAQMRKRKAPDHPEGTIDNGVSIRVLEPATAAVTPPEAIPASIIKQPTAHLTRLPSLPAELENAEGVITRRKRIKLAEESANG